MRKLTREERAYIAGFLDGDGCIMLQLIFRKDYIFGYQIRASIVFYQKQRNRQFLEWLKEKLENGYIRNRNDGMSEYAIVGFVPVKEVLISLQPFLRLKKEQVKTSLLVIDRSPKSGRQMTAEHLLKLAKEVDKFAWMNYSKKRTNTAVQVKQFLMLRNLMDPVETDS
jgi:intein-encoded DNA endonuclease-like protein